MSLKGEWHLNTVAEAGIMAPQAKENLRLPEAGRDKKRFSHRRFRGRMALAAPWIWTSNLRTVREKILLFSAPQFVVLFHGSPRNLTDVNQLSAPAPCTMLSSFPWIILLIINWYPVRNWTNCLLSLSFRFLIHSMLWYFPSIIM